MATKDKEVEVVEPVDGDETKTVKVTIDPASLTNYPVVGDLERPELVKEEVDPADVMVGETVKQELVEREVEAEAVKTPEEMKVEADKVATGEKDLLDKSDDKE